MSRNIRIVAVKENQSDILLEEVNDMPDGYYTGLQLIDVLELSEQNNVLDIVASKVKKGGKIHISGIDALKICKSVVDGVIKLTDAQEVFFSKVKRLNSLVDLKNKFLAEKDKWGITHLSYLSDRYIIEVVKQYE